MSYEFSKYITPFRLEQIEQEADNLNNQIYGDLSFFTTPLNLNQVIKVLNIDIKLVKFFNSNVEGQLTYTDQKPKIQIADNYGGKITPRQYFTIAHELGHIKLHPDYKLDVYRTDSNRHLTDEQIVIEEEADYFAGALLMPNSLFKRAWKVYRRLDTIAKFFNVSETSVKIRAKALDLY